MKIFVLLFAVFLLPTLRSFSQNCNSCRMLPKLVVYDLDIQVARPATEPENAGWQLLFSLGKLARASLANSNKDCIHFIHPLPVSTSQANTPVPVLLPAADMCNKTDYLVTGNVRQSGDGYVLHLDLQTSCSRKILVSSDLPFQASTDTNYLRSIAEQAVGRLNPLAEKINAYAISQRKQDKDVALGGAGGNSITIEPKKNNLTAGEETEVEISLRDCDGTVLAGRQIDFSGETIDGETIEGTTGGTVTPAQVVTDAMGKAKVKFKMGKDKSAVIRPHTVYKKPSGGKGVMRTARRVPKELQFVSIDIMYFKDEETTVEPSAFMPLLKGKTQRLVVNQDYYASIDHIPADPSSGYLIISVPEEGQDRSLYWDEEGSYSYIDEQPAVTLDTRGGAIEIEQEVNKESVEKEQREISPKRHASIVFFLGKDDEPMRFDIGLNFENETDIAEGNSIRAAASLSLNPNSIGAKFTTRKITDPKSGFKKEYIIEYLNKDLGSLDEVNKLTGTNLKRPEGGMYYTGQEVLWVRIRSTY